GEQPVVGRRLAEDVGSLALADPPPLGGMEAAVVDEGGSPAEPWRDEDVAGRLRPAGGRRAPDELAVEGPEPTRRLQALPGQVSLGVDDAARLARSPRREDDQRRVGGIEAGG